MRLHFYDKWIRVKVVMLAVFLAFPLEAEINALQPKFPVQALWVVQGGMLSAYLFGEWRKDKKYSREKQNEKEKANGDK
jgi:hypothetical protein